MSTHRRIYMAFFSFTALAVAGVLMPTSASCAENPPVPPQRPKVMHVSPEYIQELMKRHKEGDTEFQEAAETEELEKEPEVASSDTALEQDMLKTTKEEVLAVLDGKTAPALIPKDAAPQADSSKSIQENVSLPSAPPAPVEEITSLAEEKKPEDIAPAANTSEKMEKQIKTTEIASLGIETSRIPIPKEKPAPPEERQTTLISFALPSKEIQLDPQIKSFLEGHALPLLGKDEGMTLEINAYAKPVQGEEDSAMRVSLARALEVRRFLMDHNISPSRLKLNHADMGGNAPQDDRIDLVLVR